MLRSLLLLVIATCSTACLSDYASATGDADPNGPGGSTDGGQPGPVPPDVPAKSWTECAPGQDPAPSAMRRLSTAQYRAHIVEAFSGSAPSLIGWTSRSHIRQERATQGTLTPILAGVPEDAVDRGYARSDQRLAPTYLESYLAVSHAIGEHYLANTSNLGALVGGACLAAPDEACVGDFANKMARVLFGRSLDAAERNEDWNVFMNSPGTNAERFTMMLRTFLLHPEFIFIYEGRGAEVPGKPNVLAKTAVEKARLFSLHFFDGPTPPDLIDLAESGSPTFDDELLARASAAMRPGNVNPQQQLSTGQHVFYEFVREHLELDRFPGFSSDPLDGFAAAPHNVGGGNETYGNEMIGEQYDVSFERMYGGGNYADYLKDNSFSASYASLCRPAADASECSAVESFDAGCGCRTFLPSSLTRLYGQSGGRGSPSPATLTLSERRGILTRAGFVNSGRAYPNIIVGGVKILRKFLCRDIPDPDSNALPDGFRSGLPRDQVPDQSTRTYTHNQTSAASCAGCHNAIDPVGALLGEFDGLGRANNGSEKIFGYASGIPAVIASVPIDSSAHLNIDAQDVMVSGINHFSEVLGDSLEGKICYARQYFHFATGREAKLADSCTLARVTDALATGTLQDAWAIIVASPEFQFRVLPQ